MIMEEKVCFVGTEGLSTATANSLLSSEQIKSGWKDVEVLVLNCELNKNENGECTARQILYGITLGQKLRSAGFRKPIIFTSFLSRKQITENHLERGIVNAIGHSFLRFPYTKKELNREVQRLQKQLEGTDGRPVSGELSDLEIYDIQNNYCQKHGMAQMKIHALEGYATRGDVAPNIIKLECETCIKQVFELFEEDATLGIARFNKEFPSIDDKNKGKAVRAVSSYCLDMVDSHTGQNSGTNLMTKYPWKLLMVDDEIERSHPLISEFESRNIDVLLTKSAKEAELIFKDDNPFHPRIMVILSDYRLEEERDGVLVHQSMQGYQFLQHVSGSGRVVKISALSAMPRKFLLESFNHYGVRAQVYSKKDFPLDQLSSLKFLADEMVNTGNENWAAVQSLPDTKGWKSMEEAYVRYHTHQNFENMERKVCYVVKANIDEYEKREKEKSGKGELLDVFKTPSNDYTPEKNSAGLIDVDEDVKKFLNERIKPRRIALWLGAARNLSLPLDKIIFLMSKKVKKEGMRKKIFNSLGLVLSDFPFGITVEEQRWLEYDMGVKVLKQVEVGQEVMELIRKRVQLDFQREKFLQGYLAKTGFIHWEYNREIVEVYFSQSDYYPLFRSPHGVKALIRKVNDDIKPSDENYREKLEVLMSLRRGVLDIIKSHTNVPSFKSLDTFLKSVENPVNLPVLRKGVIAKINERREREYQRLFEPWTLLKYTGKTKEGIRLMLEKLIDSVRTGNIEKKQKGTRKQLVDIILDKKAQIPVSSDETAMNAFIYELLDKYQVIKTKEANDRYKKSSGSVDDISASGDFGTSSDVEESTEPIFGFDASIDFMESEDGGHYFDEDEKQALIAQFENLMKKHNAKADPDEDQVMFFTPSYFMKYTGMVYLPNNNDNWSKVKAVLACNGNRIVGQVDVVSVQSQQLHPVMKNTWAFTY